MCPTQAAFPLQAADSHVQSPRLLCLLVLGTTTHRELEVASSTGQLAVDLRVGIESVVHTTSLLLIQDDLQDLAAILLGSQSLTNNLNWVDDIGQDRIVDSGQGSGSWSLLCLAGSRSVGSLWSWKDTSRGEEEDVSVAELLLEFSGESLLGLVESLEKGNGDKDHDCALAVADFELPLMLDCHLAAGNYSPHTSRADWICRGRSADLSSGILVSSS